MQFSAVSVFLNILIEPTLDLLITPYKRKIYNQFNRTKNNKKDIYTTKQCILEANYIEMGHFEPP